MKNGCIQVKGKGKAVVTRGKGVATGHADEFIIPLSSISFIVREKQGSYSGTNFQVTTAKRLEEAPSSRVF